MLQSYRYRSMINDSKAIDYETIIVAKHAQWE